MNLSILFSFVGYKSISVMHNSLYKVTLRLVAIPAISLRSSLRSVLYAVSGNNSFSS